MRGRRLFKALLLISITPYEPSSESITNIIEEHHVERAREVEKLAWVRMVGRGKESGAPRGRGECHQHNRTPYHPLKATKEGEASVGHKVGTHCVGWGPREGWFFQGWWVNVAQGPRGTRVHGHLSMCPSPWCP